MVNCLNCGAADQGGRFCVRCGTPLASPPAAQISLQKRPNDAVQDTILASALPPPPPGPWSAPPGADATRGPAGRRSGSIMLAALAVVALLVAGVGVWFLLRPDPAPTPSIAVAPTSASVAPAPASTGSPTSTAQQARPSSTGSASSGSPSSPATPSPTSTSVAPDPMGGPRVDISCGTGYIVQVASELDRATFESRVAALRAAGMLPSGVKWTETSTSCGIFTNQANVLVLYTGPFSDWPQACPDRLASPPDALVKPTDPSKVGTFLACLCPAYAYGHQPPDISTVGQQGPWVGELQRVLGAGLDYDVGSINADPAAGDAGRWGTYTQETAAAVGRFQVDQGLPATQQVDAVTWAKLQNAWCGYPGE